MMLLRLCLVSILITGPVGGRSALFAQRVVRIITFERSNVFDTSDSTTPAYLKSIVNAIHVTSRESFLRKEILFTEHDVLHPSVIAESERKLRRLYFVGDVNIEEKSDGDSSDVVIRTHDKWSLTTNVSYKHDGGFESYGFALSESNFLGMGNGLLASMDYRTDRTKPLGAEFFFIGKHMPFRSWELNVQYKSSEELTIRSLEVTKPFFSEESPLSFGFAMDAGTSLRRFFRDGQIVRQEDAVQENQLAWGVASFGNETKYRFGLSLIRRTTSQIISLPRSDDQLRMAKVSFGVINRSWEEATFLNSLTRIEDRPTGYALDIIVGRNFVYRANDFLPDYYVGRGIVSAAFGKSTCVSPEIIYTRMRLSDAESEETFQYTFLAHHRIGPNDLVVWRITGTQGYHWLAGREMVLGSPNGLRGFEQYSLSGNRLLLLNFESRHVFQTPFWIFYVGTAVFADCGAVWNEDTSVSRQRFHSAVGFGIRIENTKQQGIGVIRIDVPYSLDQRRITGITISSTHFLSAFANFDNLPPHF